MGVGLGWVSWSVFLTLELIPSHDQVSPGLGIVDWGDFQGSKVNER